MLRHVVLWLFQEWELNVLQVLNWNVSAITAVDFMDLILVRLKPPVIFDKQQINIRHAQTLAALCNISKLLAYATMVVCYFFVEP